MPVQRTCQYCGDPLQQGASGATCKPCSHIQFFEHRFDQFVRELDRRRKRRRQLDAALLRACGTTDIEKHSWN